MEVFISWSGPQSEAVAKALHNWLPKVINAIKPWLSTADIDKGARWASDVALKLDSAKAGIICLTRSNLHADWIAFEAGALSKIVKTSLVCTFLIGLEPSDVEGPLAQFQTTKATRDDVLKLLKTLNRGLVQEAALPEAHIEEAFDVWWPRLEQELKKLPADDATSRPQRNERNLLEEILDLVRNQARAASPSMTDEDRDNVLSGRVNKIVFATGRIARVSKIREGTALVTTVTPRDGAGYDVVVPRNIELEDIESCVKSQIPRSAAHSTVVPPPPVVDNS